MRTLLTKYNIFLGFGILLCIAIVIFISPEKKATLPSNAPQEWNDVYRRAYKLSITTIPDIKDTNMDGTVYRKSAAKMASEFAINVVGLTPDENKSCTFTDIKKEIPELQYYMRLSCKLGIMGLDYYGDPDTVFNPNYVVTRDQLVTILSRILFGNEYNIKHGELTFSDKIRNFVKHSLANMSKALNININITTPLDWYTKHMEAIKKLGVMTNYSPTTKEFRGFVMVIMYRIDKMGMTAVKKLTGADIDPLK